MEEDPVELPIEDFLDLHAFSPRDVPAVVEAYLEEARDRGFAVVRIIHGRGIGFQRERVRSILAKTPWILNFSDAPPQAGGWGATLVTLQPKEPPGSES
jgi:DNA-nicking Smr family endonuclease